MALQKYEQQGLLFNTNFLEKSSQEGLLGYRGDLILVKGEVADAQGRSKPPVALMYSGVLLSKDDKLVLTVGFIDKLELLSTFIEKYQADFDKDMKALLFVVNIKEPMQVEVDGINFVLIPLLEGVSWNELVDELCMEKSDFKGQSAADKIVTAWEEFKKGYAPKYERVTYDVAMTRTADIKREARGAV